MLHALKVHNFVLIDALELALEPGFNVLTGETGAGKSIVVGALGLVLGGRARADMVRPGSKEAEVEALFEVEGSEAVLSRLAEAGVPCDGELVIRRLVSANGRSRAYLNGRLCSVAELTSLARELADVTSQHESVALTDPSRHLIYLDRYAGLTEACATLSRRVDELLALARRIRELCDAESSRGEREDFVRYQLEQIDLLDPQAGELDALRSERSRLRHADQLAGACQRVADQLAGDGDGVCDALAAITSTLERAADLDDGLAPLAQEVRDCFDRLRDCAREVERYADSVHADPRRLEEAQERLFALEKLLKSHGPTIDDVFSARDRLQAELDSLTSAQTALPRLREEQRASLESAGKDAQRLSRQRHAAAAKLSAAISRELADLGMGTAKVVVDVEPLEPRDDDGLTLADTRLSHHGIDRVQFLIAPNKGMAPRPLGRIASGGELSRALLALKRAFLESAQRGDAAGIQVFDEVDSGVGGETADHIGRAIAAIARERQVLCITHLAAIAAYADAHFVVHKLDEGDSTRSIIERADRQARVAELARMLTGQKVTRSSRKAAAELLAASRAA